MTPKSTPEAHQNSRWRSRLAIFAVLSAMAVIALITVAPTLGRLLANHLASRLLGEPVTVSWLKVGFAPLRLTAIKVHLGSPLGPKAERVTLTFPGSNLWQGRVEPQTIEIVGLRASADLSCYAHARRRPRHEIGGQ